MDVSLKISNAKLISRNTYTYDRLIAQRTLSLVSFLVPLSLLVVYLIAPHASDSGAESILLVITSFVILITGGRLVKNWNFAKPDSYQIAGVFIDFLATALILIAYASIYEVPISVALKSPTANMFFIYLASRVVLFRGPIMVKTGIIASTTWLILVFLSLYEPNAVGRTRGYVEYLTSFKVLIGAEVERILQFLIITVVLRLYISFTRNDPHTGLLRRSPFLEAISKYLGAANHKHADCCHAFIEVRTMDISKAETFYSSFFSLIPNLPMVTSLKFKRLGRLSRHSIGMWIEHPSDKVALELYLNTLKAELIKTAVNQQGLGVPDLIIGGTLVEKNSSGEELISHTDMAIKDASQNGKTVIVYTDAIHAKIREKLRVEQIIKHGLKKGLVSVKYQPIIDFMTSTPVGFEALIRLHDKNNKVISPDTFIPIAETSDLINQLMSELCQQIADEGRSIADAYASSEHAPYMNINIAPSQLKDMSRVMKALEVARTGSGLKVNAEITESSFLHEVDAVEKMRVLRDKGYDIAIDDFGTGYSSLYRLKAFDFSTLKIDKSFVDNIDIDSSASAFLEAMVKLAKTASGSVIIEGVETVQQQALIMKMGVRLCQGYLFAKPMKLNELLDYLSKTHGIKGEKYHGKQKRVGRHLPF